MAGMTVQCRAVVVFVRLWLAIGAQRALLSGPLQREAEADPEARASGPWLSVAVTVTEWEWLLWSTTRAHTAGETGERGAVSGPRHDIVVHAARGWMLAGRRTDSGGRADRQRAERAERAVTQSQTHCGCPSASQPVSLRSATAATAIAPARPAAVAVTATERERRLTVTVAEWSAEWIRLAAGLRAAARPVGTVVDGPSEKTKQRPGSTARRDQRPYARCTADAASASRSGGNSGPDRRG